MFLKGLRMLPVRLLARRVMPVKEENIIICFSHKKQRYPFFIFIASISSIAAHISFRNLHFVFFKSPGGLGLPSINLLPESTTAFFWRPPQTVSTAYNILLDFENVFLFPLALFSTWC